MGGGTTAAEFDLCYARLAAADPNASKDLVSLFVFLSRGFESDLARCNRFNYFHPCLGSISVTAVVSRDCRLGFGIRGLVGGANEPGPAYCCGLDEQLCRGVRDISE